MRNEYIIVKPNRDDAKYLKFSESVNGKLVPVWTTDFLCAKIYTSFYRCNAIAVAFGGTAVRKEATKDIARLYTKANAEIYTKTSATGRVGISSPLFLLHEVDRVIFSPPYTIVIWKTNKEDKEEKTIVKCTDGDTFCEHTGFTAALAKRMYGSQNQYKKLIKNAFRPQEVIKKKVVKK